MFEIRETIKDHTGKRVDFEYVCSKDISKYFTKNKFYCEYNIDINSVPNEILNIPLLGNILPISWFGGFDVKVQKLDKIFYEQALKLKQQFSEYYPIIKTKVSNLIVDELVDVDLEVSGKTGMLFSGGVDAYTTLLRHYKEIPDLITVKGADIAIKDVEQWQGVVNYNTTTAAINTNIKYYIESNLREFISFEVDQLLPGLGWWGKIQHGLALTCLTAPIAYINRYETIYIASTRSSKMPFSPWGSMPETDNLVKFGNCSLSHDGYELTRLDKVNSILVLSKIYKVHPPLRVCYHDLKEEINCNSCEKCCRTIFAIMVNNENPNLYGFSTDVRIYKLIQTHLKNGFSTEGVKFYWDELIKNVRLEDFYFFDNLKEEKKELEKLIELNIIAQDKGVNNKDDSTTYILKHKFINHYPKIFKLYLKLRRKLS